MHLQNNSNKIINKSISFKYWNLIEYGFIFLAFILILVLLKKLLGEGEIKSISKNDQPQIIIIEEDEEEIDKEEEKEEKEDKESILSQDLFKKRSLKLPQNTMDYFD